MIRLNIKSVSEEKPVFLRLSVFQKSKSKTKEKSKILRLCFYRKVKRFFYNSSQKVLRRLLAQVHYDLCQRMARKADLAEVGPLAGCPKRKSLCVARNIGQPERRKPSVVRARFLNFSFARQKGKTRLSGSRVRQSLVTLSVKFRIFALMSFLATSSTQLTCRSMS